ncbi:hypothetical protein Hypma_009758 [Hypsizygus marmoreus]|uniref:F-box domain-containing protein n=1 Tax=Hypsizygus marmoreus TaxID=39966 RepID=A0A369JUW1_HYPMA|nr:hypothetical protein Hypma_009758 [Hypsizygus marmoreus]
MPVFTSSTILETPLYGQNHIEARDHANGRGLRATHAHVLGPQELSALESRASSFDQLFNTNNPPTDLEREELRRLLHDVKRALSILKAMAIQEPYYIMLLKAIRSKCTSALSALRRLPTEVISEIFSHNIPHHPRGSDPPPRPTFDTAHAPWTLLMVSRRWRTIVWNYQRIWSFISIDVLHNAILTSEILKLRFCLQRSGGHDFSIYFQDGYPQTLLGRIKIFRILMAHSRRWRYVTLFTHFENLEKAVRVRENLPRLRYLRLCGYGAPQNRIIDAFEVAPELREVCLDTADPLTRVPQLESCDIQLLIQRPGTKPPPLVLHHSKLRRLHTAALYQSVPNDHATVLSLPALEELCVNNITPRSTSDLNRILILIDRSSCSLRSLTIASTIIMDPVPMRILLHRCPGLERLKIVHGLVNWEKMIDLLTITDSKSCVVPKLKKITFIFGCSSATNPYPNFDPSSLIRMVESRWYKAAMGRQVARLESLTLRELPQRIPEHLMERIQYLKVRGLKVAIDEVRTVLGEREDLD